MAEYRILAWRGIPAQVKVTGSDGDRANATLPERYQEEIDRIAMDEGLMGSDDYLDLWKWGPSQQRDGSSQQVLEAVIADLVAHWDLELFGESRGEQ